MIFLYDVLIIRCCYQNFIVGDFIKTVIVGAGSMGCLLGSFLVDKGYDVWFLDIWAEHVKALNNRGLKIIDLQGKEKVLSVRAVEKPDSRIDNPDLVIIMVKAYDTIKAVQTIRAISGETTKVLTFQNGLGNAEILKEHFSDELIYLGTTSLGAYITEPGVVKQAGSGKTYIGRAKGGTSKDLIELVSYFENANLEVRESRVINTLIWDKLIVNVGINALTAVLNITNGKLLEFEETKTLLKLLIQEAEQVAYALGVELSNLDQSLYIQNIVQATSDNYSSMCQDMKNSRKTEINAINGAVVKKGMEVGVKTPYNKMITLLVNSMEKISVR